MNQQRRKLLRALWRKAEEADQNESSATAVELLQLYLRFDPEKCYAHFLLAENRRALGRLDDAEESMKRVRDIPNAKQWLVHLCWAEIHAAKGRKSEAERTFRLAINLMPSSTVPYVYFAEWLGRQQRFSEAIEILTSGLLAEGDIDEVYLNLGNYKRALKDFVGAKDCYQQSLKVNPSCPEAKKRLADVLGAIQVLKESTKM